MDRTSHPAATLQAIRGSPSTVLLALLLFPGRTLGPKQLTRLTGLTEKTVQRALDLLADHHLAQRHAYREGWAATALIRQRILGEVEEGEPYNYHSYLDETKPENLRFQGSSRGSLPGQNESSPYTTTTTTTAKPEILRLDVSWQPVVESLTHRCGTPPDRARAAAAAAQARGDDPAQVVEAIEGWRDYCTSERGRTIYNPGALIAARIEAGIDSPSLGQDGDRDRYRGGEYADSVEW